MQTNRIKTALIDLLRENAAIARVLHDAAHPTRNLATVGIGDLLEIASRAESENGILDES